MGLFETGIRPAIDKWLLDEAAKERNYGDYWSASSAGYCMRKQIFDRLKVPHTKEADPRKQRVFTAGHIFHDWIQELTKNAGISIAQEVELQDEDLMIRGHFDDLILVNKLGYDPDNFDKLPTDKEHAPKHLILYDYKTQNSRAFSYKRPEMSHYHKMQLATYMYMLRNYKGLITRSDVIVTNKELTEARILKISKDDLRMSEEQLLWSPALEKEVYEYWSTLNGYWKSKTIPRCTCADYEGGFLAKEAYNDYFYDGEPCSLKWYEKNKPKEA